MHAPKIYIADDSRIQLILLEKVLQNEGYSVEAFTDGADLITSLSAETPDLIISDIDMPNTNGFELIEEVRGMLPEDEYIPCFLISANGDKEVRKRAQSIGVDEFIKKPLEQQVLMDVIEEVFNNKKVSSRSECNY